MVTARPPDPPHSRPAVATLVPLPGSVVGAAVVIAAQAMLAGFGVFVALLATHSQRIHYLGHGIGAWRFGAAIMLSVFALSALTAAVGLTERHAWARPLAFAVEAGLISAYLLTFVFSPVRALIGIAVAVAVMALVLGPRADAAFGPVEDA